MAWKPPAANTATAWWCAIPTATTSRERHHLAALQSYNVEGLIVNTLGHHPGELRALHRELPMVLVDRQLAELDTDLVGLDNADAVEQALDHLQHRGFRDILLVTEPLDGTSSRIERVQAFNASIGRRPALKGQVLQTDDFFRDGLRAFLSASGPGPKALFTCNGVATLCATRQLRDLGCRLFDEVGLLALDELRLVPTGGQRHHRPRPTHRRNRPHRLRAPPGATRRRPRAGAPGDLPGATDRSRLDPSTRLAARRRCVAGGFRTA